MGARQPLRGCYWNFVYLQERRVTFMTDMQHEEVDSNVPLRLHASATLASVCINQKTQISGG